MSYSAKRADLLALAEHLHAIKKELLDTISQINPAVANLVAASDALLPTAADEAMEGVVVKRISYSGDAAPESSPGVRAVVESVRTRKCSLCKGEDHDARNCPKRAEIEKAKRKEKK